ncbi:MAG TPA: ATP-binding protein [Alphaproteobacteria bacterium]|jgi:hypothetical protein|nr:ATP-binding protein [Alphaproteobacteria bacterium]
MSRAAPAVLMGLVVISSLHAGGQTRDGKRRAARMNLDYLLKSDPQYPAHHLNRAFTITTHRGGIRTMSTPTSTTASPDPQKRNRHETPQSGGYALIDTCKFKIRTVQEARSLAHFAAGIFKDPARIEPGLYELLLNAVEHGCLEIGYALKTRLLEYDTWEMEIIRKQSLPQNREKHVEIVIARRSEGIFVVITDPGPGFDWKSWLTVDPARTGNSHGRGIARARDISFDIIAFNAKGNQVAAHTRDLSEKKMTTG